MNLVLIRTGKEHAQEPTNKFVIVRRTFGEECIGRF